MVWPRSIIHNSDYKTLDDAKAAIDRYFADRNAHFTLHPKRAGKKIWGKEREVSEFSHGEQLQGPTLPLKAPICVRIKRNPSCGISSRFSRVGRNHLLIGVFVPREMAHADWIRVQPVTDMRRTSLTLAADTFSSRAVSRTPRPSSNASTNALHLERRRPRPAQALAR